ncbi:MAG: protein-glutamate O-methyltransferase CheR [Deltaproteobacteria bacterium]
MQAAAFGYIRQMVKQQAGIVVEHGKEYLAESRLKGFARDQGFATLDQFVDTLRVSPFGESHRRVIELLTTNETSFFRDVRPFEALRQTIIPRLVAARPGRNLVIWCAASSSGQEPYSVAMLLREYFPALASTTRIIASDISRDMIARTRDATYSQFEVRRGLPAPMLAKYLVPNGARWQMKPELRTMIETREINLAGPFPALPPIDILLVRNVLIYFDAAKKQDIMIRMRKVLAQDGVLMLGGAETALGVDAGFDRCTADNKAAWYGPR